MAALPLKQQYGPTLGQLLAPRWRAVSPILRTLVIALFIALLGVVVAVVLTIQDARYSHRGRVPFSFKYKGLFKTRTPPGAYVRIQLLKEGALEDSFEVSPLKLSSYAGSVTGELPLFSAGYAAELRTRYGSSFQVDGEGKTRVKKVPGYNLFYSVVLKGRLMYGRDVLITPEREGARDGVIITMLTASDANHQVSSPTLVAGQGVLKRPLETFNFE